MQSGIKEAPKWMRNRESASIPIIKAPDGTEAETRVEALEMIRKHWEKVWNRFSSETERQTRLEAAKQMFREEFERLGCVPNQRWERPTSEEFHNKLREAGGAGGPDGWIAEEVNFLPLEVAEVFAELTARWEEHGEAPEEMPHARQVNLEKPGKRKVEQGIDKLLASDA